MTMEPVGTSVTPDTKWKIEQFMELNNLSYRAEAVRQLLELGLAAHAAQTAVPPTPNSMLSTRGR